MAILRAMTPEHRLRRAFELTEREKRNLKRKLRTEHPEMNERQIFERFADIWTDGLYSPQKQHPQH